MQTVEFFTRRDRRVPFVRKDAFALREDRGFVWLQKLAIFVLAKLGCQLVEDRVEVQRVVLDGRTFVERILKQRAELERHFNKRAVSLLIGAEDYADLMGSPEITQMLTFRADDAYMYRGEFMGLTVTIVPWMRGLLVMP